MNEAWGRFGHLPEGWARVQAVCDFVHNHVQFSDSHAHVTKTAADGCDWARACVAISPI